MFDIGWSEMALILLVALIVIGPKDLPRVARSVGQWVGKGRAMAREFQRALEDMAREAELDKVKSEIEKAGRTNVGKTIEKSIDPSGELSKAFDPNAGSRTASGAKRTQGDQPAEGETKPGPAAGAPVAAANPAPAGNGGGAPEARKEAATEAPPAAPAPAAAPAKRKRRAPAGNGAAVAEDATEPVRTTAPAEPG
jgi:sec-independent protein translocase protein TatB